MRYQEFLTEAAQKDQVVAALKSAGFEDVRIKGNLIAVLVQIPAKQKKDAFRVALLQDIERAMQQAFPEDGAKIIQAQRLKSSIGGVVFDASPIGILVKDIGAQGDQSAGVANEIELASMIESVIQKYGNANVTFVDPRGKELTLQNCSEVQIAGRDTKGRKKADVVLRSESGNLPISIKKLNADAWESADKLFGGKASAVLQNLQDQGVIKLRQSKDDEGNTIYSLDKEIVVEPTEEESMQAIFGSDINPAGGVVIQTFAPEHFRQDGNNVFVQCHAIIKEKSDIPESHMMVWLIRNDRTRKNPLPGLRTLGVTLKRGIGTRGDKDVILVDRSGRVIRR